MVWNNKNYPHNPAGRPCLPANERTRTVGVCLNDEQIAWVKGIGGGSLSKGARKAIVLCMQNMTPPEAIAQKIAAEREALKLKHRMAARAELLKMPRPDFDPEEDHLARINRIFPDLPPLTAEAQAEAPKSDTSDWD